MAVGGLLDPLLMLAGYRRGLFTMEVSPGILGWFSPDPRGILPLGALRVSRSLRRAVRAMRVSFDTEFAAVVSACASPGRPGHWITPEFERVYRGLHRAGQAHSVEVWRGDRLVGGLFGVECAGLFSGESMFHRDTDASKVALVALVQRLRDAGGRRLLDIQWWTPHLGSLGAVAVPRLEYLRMLAEVRDEVPALGH